jgi:nucleoside-diphosphate-sugar epimerase
MNVFIAGSTGVLGRRLVRELTARRHAVTGLVRSREGEKLVASLGGQPRWASLFDADGLVHAAQGAEVVIHAATAIPAKPRTSPSDWDANDRIRREGTQALATCAGRIGAKLYIQQSVVWVACPADGSEFDENTTPHPGPIEQSALDAERCAQEIAARWGFKACVLRCGWFYGPDSSHTKMFGRELARRRLPIIGQGKAVWSCLHLDDAAGSFVAAAEAGTAGLWHVTDNEPVTVREYMLALAQRLGARPPRSIPVWLARLFAGKQAVEFFTRSMRTTGARFEREIGWSPKYPSYREGLDQVVAAWGGRAPQ